MRKKKRNTETWDVYEYESHASAGSGVRLIEKGITGTINLPVNLQITNTDQIIPLLKREDYIDENQHANDYCLDGTDANVIYIDHGVYSVPAFELHRKIEASDAITK